MARYTLSINIKSDNKDLLDNLMVTLETINGNLNDVDAVELFAVEETATHKTLKPAALPDPTVSQRNLFLDKWMLTEAV